MPTNDLEQIKIQLVRQASKAIVGGFRPSDDPFVSWLGRVRVALLEETWPVSSGKPMMPLAQFNLTEAPYRPANLADIALITVFIDQDELPVGNLANGEKWLLRAYPSLNGLVPLDAPTGVGHLRPFPVRWELIPEDYPTWDDAYDLNLPQEIDENYYDLFETQDCTKIGGWPSTIQSEIFWAPWKQHPAEPEYTFQIDSEEKAYWMWGDSGTGYFGRGTGQHRDVWTLEWQCY